MANKFLFLASLFVLAATASASDKGQFRYTGNPRVDFFQISGSGLAPADANRPIFESPDENTGTDQEKSPWIAGLLSLAVPGSGEVYTKNYIKGAVFFAAEAVAWITVLNYDKKGDDQTQLFQNYANEHYSVVRYANWTLDNLGTLHPSPAMPRTREEYHQAIYASIEPVDPENSKPPFSNVNWVALNGMEQDIANGVLNGYTHSLPYYSEQQYYELIGKYDQFSRGWDDSNLDPSAPLDAADPSSQVIKSNSKRFYEYSRMRAQANHYYDIAGTWMAVAVANHLLSALDAYWSATRYNSSLHAGVRMRLEPTPFGLVPVTEASLRLDF
jgi:hypothetical protein